MSASSLHRESTDSLIHCIIQVKYKNEVGCRDNTVPKSISTRQRDDSQ